jgi:phosphate transport system substrate-binding protein
MWVREARSARCRGRRTRVVVSSLIACFMSFVTFSADADTVRTGGTGAALGTMRVLAEAYKKTEPQFALDIVPNLGSGGGLKALEHGAIDFAVISRGLKGDEIAQGYVAFEYGRTPFVVATSRAHSPGLTLAQIADIYSGRVNKWPDGTAIRLILRPANDGDTPLLAAFSPGIKEALATAMAREGMIVAITDQDSANDIGRIKGAIGTSSLALILSEQRNLTALSIDGVKPSVNALADGTYPHYKSLYIVSKGTAPGAAARFIAFVRSSEGRRALMEMGHWVPGGAKSSAGR